MTYFTAILPTPVLNRADFSVVFGGTKGSLPFDQLQLVRAVEMIAFPGTVFEIIKEHPPHILEVQTAEYPSLNSLYVDVRFGKIMQIRPPERERRLPPLQTILERMKNRVGTPYIWGGNISAGVPELLEYYPATRTLTNLEWISWTCQGVDCSGLLYEATEGAVPRNTRDLLFIGRSVAVQDIAWRDILSRLKPLDLLIWQGHVVIVYDEKTVIESKHEWGGVCMTNLKERLAMIREVGQKIPTNDPTQVLQNSDSFLVRRFIS